jgi:hypothetical protein
MRLRIQCRQGEELLSRRTAKVLHLSKQQVWIDEEVVEATAQKRSSVTESGKKRRRLPGRPEVAANIRDSMSQANPLRGAPRIHGELLKLGIAVAQSTVARYLPRSHKPPSQGRKNYGGDPLDQPLIRRLVVLKFWQARDTFDPGRLINKLEQGAEFDWDDLCDLVRRDARIDRERICADCVRGFWFLADLTTDEQALANDPHQREQSLWERLRPDLARG